MSTKSNPLNFEWYDKRMQNRAITLKTFAKREDNLKITAETIKKALQDELIIRAFYKYPFGNPCEVIKDKTKNRFNAINYLTLKEYTVSELEEIGFDIATMLLDHVLPKRLEQRIIEWLVYTIETVSPKINVFYESQIKLLPNTWRWLLTIFVYIINEKFKDILQNKQLRIHFYPKERKEGHSISTKEVIPFIKYKLYATLQDLSYFCVSCSPLAADSQEVVPLIIDNDLLFMHLLFKYLYYREKLEPIFTIYDLTPKIKQFLSHLINEEQEDIDLPRIITTAEQYYLYLLMYGLNLELSVIHTILDTCYPDIIEEQDILD